MSAEPDDRLVAFYVSVDESTRLLKREGRVEQLRTQRLIAGAIAPPPGRILDVGGGDGVHARWLQRLGYDVELVDLVPAHVEQAKASGLRARVGDARSLPHESHSFDAVLVLGPLYHLARVEDRLRVLEEARRVARPGGVVAAAAVNRLAVAMDLYRKGRLDDRTLAEARVICASGFDPTGYDPSGRGGALFYFHSTDELTTEMRAANLEAVRVHGLEGPLWPLIDADSVPDDTTVELVTAVAELADGDTSAIGASAHLLALGTTPARS